MNGRNTMLKEIKHKQISQLLVPETSLERHLLSQPELVEGLSWGEPRFGHPEGKVYLHVKEIYANIDQLHDLSTKTRSQLRLVALIHDGFKFREVKSSPRNWDMHHASIARRFAEQHIDDPMLLSLVELHDEAYYCWRAVRRLANDDIEARYTVESLLQKVEPFLMEYMLFFRCDTLTGDKNPAPLNWFEDTVGEARRLFL